MLHVAHFGRAVFRGRCGGLRVEHGRQRPAPPPTAIVAGHILANMHDIGVTWHHCSETGCDFKSKIASDLTRHLANKHNIGVIWKYCSVTGCEYKSKNASDLIT